MFKNGELVVRDGKVVKVVKGATHVARPDYDRAIEKPLKDYFDRYLTVRMENFRLSDEEIVDGGRGSHRRPADGSAGVHEHDDQRRRRSTTPSPKPSP